MDERGDPKKNLILPNGLNKRGFQTHSLLIDSQICDHLDPCVLALWVSSASSIM